MDKKFDINAIRKEFPILTRKIHGKPLVYLDNAATTQKPKAMIDALTEFYTQHNANIHRGLHTLSVESTELYEEAHVKAAKFIGASSMQEIVFTRNTTESLNLVAFAWGRKNLHRGDVVVITEEEHHSNIVPWQILAKEIGIRVEWVPVKDDGMIDMEAYKNIIQKNRRRVKIVSVVHISNVLGTVNPVAEIGQIAHEAGAIFIVDAAQSASRLRLDVKALGVDFLAFSAHKMYGPTGIGVLYGRREILEKMDPWMGGGDMIKKVQKEGFIPNELPWRFEAGTPNIADGAVFPKAIEFIEKIGFDFITRHEIELIDHTIQEMRKLEWLKIFGSVEPGLRLGVVTFYVDGIHPHDLASLLDEDGIAIRAGYHCAMPLHLRFGVPATARMSFAVYNTIEEIDFVIDRLKNAREHFV